MLSEQALAQPDALRVTSTSSSLLMKSVIAQTELDGGVSFMAKSDVEERTLVCFFSLHVYRQVIAPGCWPTIIPSYTCVPGSMKVVPLLWALLSRR